MKTSTSPSLKAIFARIRADVKLMSQYEGMSFTSHMIMSEIDRAQLRYQYETEGRSLTAKPETD